MIKKKLGDCTIKEVRRFCDARSNCINCPLANRSGRCKMLDYTPSFNLPDFMLNIELKIPEEQR